uniref:Uncharacterized protein n=1 Tax=Arundo donax TaxID=35708 RepID=A0A0A8Z5Y9_ARUDO
MRYFPCIISFPYEVYPWKIFLGIELVQMFH